MTGTEFPNWLAHQHRLQESAQPHINLPFTVEITLNTSFQVLKMSTTRMKVRHAATVEPNEERDLAADGSEVEAGRSIDPITFIVLRQFWVFSGLKIWVYESLYN